MLAQAALLIYDLKICTGADGMGGMSLGSFEYFGREVVGNELAFLGHDESAIVKNEAAPTKYVHRTVSTKIYENQLVVIEFNDIDLSNYKVVSNSSISCAFGLPSDALPSSLGSAHEIQLSTACEARKFTFWLIVLWSFQNKNIFSLLPFLSFPGCSSFHRVSLSYDNIE